MENGAELKARAPRRLHHLRLAIECIGWVATAYVLYASLTVPELLQNELAAVAALLALCDTLIQAVPGGWHTFLVVMVAALVLGIVSGKREDRQRTHKPGKEPGNDAGP